MFRPKRNKDGSITDHEMLTVAATLLSAADDKIDELGRRASVINGPMFLSAKPDSDTDIHSKDEPTFFLKYLTIRNFVSATVLLAGALWAVFTWYSADKGAQLVMAQSRLEASDRRADLAEKAKAQLEADTAYWKKNADDYSKEIPKKVAETEAQRSEVAKQKSRADTLQTELTNAQAEKNKLIASLTAASTTPCPPAK